MSTVLVIAGLLAAVGVRVYVGLLIAQELDKNPSLRQQYRKALVAGGA